MANQKVIDKKQQIVDEVAKKMTESKSVVVAEYQGLTVEKIQTLRRNLRDEGCEMFVIKNNISRRAAESNGYKELMEDLSGPNSMIFSYEDQVSAAKVLYEFAKKNKKLKIKSGIVDGKFYEQEKIKEISALPNREGLLTMLAGQLLSPLRELAIGLYLLTEEDESEESEEAETKEEPKKETKVEVKEETKKETKAEPKAEAKAEKKVEAKADAKKEAKAEPKAKTKEEPKKEAKAKAEPKKETKEDKESK
ncbi:MAG: 50S ribosomal protein L10 [Candidatus Izimaplasma sp.]|nr:50S ribosomal protein L10 [Candidatus Izimaplasma bacterium]